MTLNTGALNTSSQSVGSLASPIPTSPAPAGPGGNTIVPTPASPNEWWKMLIAIGILSGGIWMIQMFGSEAAARWAALLVILGIITYYETHGNTKFSTALQDLLGSIR